MCYRLDIIRLSPSKNRLAKVCKSCKYFSCKTCQTLHQNEAFLARSKKTCTDLARKIEQDNFLARFDQILQEMYVSCSVFLQDQCNIFCFLQEKLHLKCKTFMILARFSARSYKSCKKNTCKTCFFLERQFILGPI